MYRLYKAAVGELIWKALISFYNWLSNSFSVTTGIGRVNLQQLFVCSCGFSLGRTCCGCGLGRAEDFCWNDALEFRWVVLMKRGWKMGEDKTEVLLPFLFIEIVETGEEMAGTRGAWSVNITSWKQTCIAAWGPPCDTNHCHVLSHLRDYFAIYDKICSWCVYIMMMMT